MSEQYFFVCKLGLGKEVVSLSLVVTEVSRGGMRILYNTVCSGITGHESLVSSEA